MIVDTGNLPGSPQVDELIYTVQPYLRWRALTIIHGVPGCAVWKKTPSCPRHIPVCLCGGCPARSMGYTPKAGCFVRENPIENE